MSSQHEIRLENPDGQQNDRQDNVYGRKTTARSIQPEDCFTKRRNRPPEFKVVNV